MVKYDNKIMVLIVLSILVVSALALGCTQAAKQYSIATGGVAGTYYPIGIAIARAT